MRVEELCAFMRERESVRKAKEAGKPRPWTSDEILNTYRFCNVHREDDKVTRWIAKNLRDPNDGMPELWFILVIARLLNNPESLTAVNHVMVPWKPERFRSILHDRKAQGLGNFNAAYIVSTNGVTMDKVDYIIQFVLGPLWRDRKLLTPFKRETLQSYHNRITEYDGIGSFIGAQVVADLKYTCWLSDAPDWHTWAAPGPGSMRGLNRVMDRSVDATWPGGTWLQALTLLRAAVQRHLRNRLEIHAQDLQNCLCEFDKYERVRLGEGRPKQLYKES